MRAAAAVEGRRPAAAVRKRAAVEREPVFLDALQVEQFVDQRERCWRAQHVVGELATCSGPAPSGARRSNCVKPMTAFSGVRISWLTRERNSLLARLAIRRPAGRATPARGRERREVAGRRASHRHPSGDAGLEHCRGSPGPSSSMSRRCTSPSERACRHATSRRSLTARDGPPGGRPPLGGGQREQRVVGPAARSQAAVDVDDEPQVGQGLEQRPDAGESAGVAPCAVGATRFSGPCMVRELRGADGLTTSNATQARGTSSGGAPRPITPLPCSVQVLRRRATIAAVPEAHEAAVVAEVGQLERAAMPVDARMRARRAGRRRSTGLPAAAQHDRQVAAANVRVRSVQLRRIASGTARDSGRRSSSSPCRRVRASSRYRWTGSGGPAAGACPGWRKRQVGPGEPVDDRRGDQGPLSPAWSSRRAATDRVAEAVGP